MLLTTYLECATLVDVTRIQDQDRYELFKLKQQQVARRNAKKGDAHGNYANERVCFRKSKDAKRFYRVAIRRHGSPPQHPNTPHPAPDGTCASPPGDIVSSPEGLDSRHSSGEHLIPLRTPISVDSNIR